MHIEKRKKIMLYLIGAIAIGFLLITAFVFFFPNSFIDREFSEEVQEHQNPLLDLLMKGISYLGYMPYAAIMVVVAALLFYLFKYKREALFVVLTSLSGLVSSAIKLVIDRPRPSEPSVKILVKTTQQSFPSGHVLFYVIFFGFVALLMFELKSIPKYISRSIAVICLLLVFTIPYSRVYLGAHWFTDVTAGFFLGVICLYVLGLIYLKPKRAIKS